MSATKPHRVQELVVRDDKTLIAIPALEGDRLVTRYHVEYLAESPLEQPQGMRRPSQEVHESTVVQGERIRIARLLAGAWKDLDWDEMEESLYRIRHESTPTPPIDLNDIL